MVHEPGALVKETALSDESSEYRMRVRVSLRALWAMDDMWVLFNPERFGLFSVRLTSHKLLRYLAALPLCLALLCNLVLVGDGGYFRKGHFYLYEKSPDDQSQTLFACGGAFMVDRKHYLELGGFDTLYHPLYYEEIDLSYRALKRGWRVVYEPKSIAYHKVQSTITRQEKRRQIGLISARNNYLFVWKNILDGGMTRQFLIYIPLFLLRDLFSLKSRFCIAFTMALKRLPLALAGRKKERIAVRFSDKEILERINVNRPTHVDPK